MYNGIGLQTPRGSGTNGHVQRNFAFVRPGKKDNIHYRTEEDIAKLEATTNRQPNLGILDHERKRKIEVKCAELEEALESQGFTEEEIQAKVDAYRSKLMGTNSQNGNDIAKDEHGRPILKETHEIAKAQQEKNAKLREAFGISEYFVEGTSFDADRKAREDLAKSEAIQKVIQADNADQKKYALVRTPSPESDLKLVESGEEEERESKKKVEKKKKKKRELSSSSERKKDKKKKSKKHKKESGKKKRSKKHQSSDESSDSSESETSSSSSDTSSESSEDDRRKKRKKNKKNKKKKSKKQKQARERSSERDRSPSNRRKDFQKSRNNEKSIEVVRGGDKRRDNRDERKERSRSRDVRRKSPVERSRYERKQRSISHSPPPKKVSRRESKTPERKSLQPVRAISRQQSNQQARRRSPTPPKRNRSPSPPPLKRNRSPSPPPLKRNRTPSPLSLKRNRSRSRDKNPRRLSRGNSRRNRSVEKRIERRRNATPPPAKRKSPERKRSIERKRSATPRKRSFERKRSVTPKKRSFERRRTPEKKRVDSRRWDKTPVERNQQIYSGRKRSASRSKSPIQKKTLRYESSSQKNNERPLSYSPARRNPERYKEILDSKKSSEKPKKQAGPVVKLHPSDSDHESSEGQNSSKVDDYLFDKNQDKELNRLKALKSELAAKAKESLERKLISESAAGGSQRKIDANPVIQQVMIARSEGEVAVKSSTTKPTAEKKDPSSHHKSRSNKRSHRSESSSESSRSSRSHSTSGESRRSSSRSSHSSHSSSSSSHSGSSRSLSIPRRAGSPSFLDRRRITRSRSHSRSYYRQERR